jgi:hypothetical protein
MDGLILPIIVTSIRTRVDGSLSVTAETNELSPTKAGELFSLRGKTAMMYLSPKDVITQKEIDQVNAIDAEIEAKTPSKRLRDVLYVLFTQQPEGYKEFDSFYKYKMSIITDHLKSKLQ